MTKQHVNTKCRFSSDDVPAPSESNLTSPVKPSNDDNQFSQHDFPQSDIAATRQDFEIILRRSTRFRKPPDCIQHYH